MGRAREKGTIHANWFTLTRVGVYPRVYYSELSHSHVPVGFWGCAGCVDHILSCFASSGGVDVTSMLPRLPAKGRESRLGSIGVYVVGRIPFPGSDYCVPVEPHDDRRSSVYGMLGFLARRHVCAICLTSDVIVP
jgi:hypothetical protein